MRIDCVACRSAWDIDDALIDLDANLVIGLARIHGAECQSGELQILLRGDSR